jgi:hypothetical protein
MMSEWYLENEMGYISFVIVTLVPFYQVLNELNTN